MLIKAEIEVNEEIKVASAYKTIDEIDMASRFLKVLYSTENLLIVQIEEHIGSLGSSHSSWPAFK